MSSGVYTVVSGAVAQEIRLASIANNLANAQTPGYKASKPIFEAVLSNAVIDSENPNTYVAVYDAHVDFSNAPLIQSGSELDLAVVGDGFFVIDTPKGPMYTRNGQFTIDSEKHLVTMSGDRVRGDGGPITVDGRQIIIENDGSVFVDGQMSGKITVVDFENKSYLKPAGKGYFMNSEPTNGEIEASNYSVKQGAYEASNVEVMKEMVEMIATVRAYESYTKLQQADTNMTAKLLEVGRF
ncbi:MAG TPA: flagellar basal-body rod protein FlgF [Deltaproteobacteria bacterium]|nr:flagellar basal-body rod protein FlgF [Deltaproteobacteria bacterium]